MADGDGSSSPEERSLHELLRRVAGGGGIPEPLDETDLLDYLAGSADEATARRLQQRVASSATLRRDLVDLSSDLEGLSRAEIQRRFDALPRTRARSSPFPAPRPAPDRGPFLERLFGLFRVPAFAAAFTFALMAYPTFRFFSDERGRPDAVLSLQAVPVRAERAATRGGGAGDPVPVSRGSGRLVELALWAETRPAPDETLRLTVEGPGGVLHTDADFRSVVDRAGDPAYRIVLDGGRVGNGVLTIRVEHFRGAADSASRTETYRVLLSD